jgi:HlyD family secretion protein
VLRVVQESEIALGVGAPILEIGDLGRLEARIDVLSTEATRIQPQAYVALDAGGVKLAGRVRRVADGYRVDAAIEVAREENVLLVPLAALFRDHRGEERATVVDGLDEVARVSPTRPTPGA